MRRPRREGHGLPRNEGTCSLGLASEWKGIEHGRKCELDPAWDLGLMVVIWATKFLTAIRLEQKLKKLGWSAFSQERHGRKFD